LKNICLEIEYDGTNYQGWQAQKIKGIEPATIQGFIEKVLAKIFQQKIKLIGSGRTDSGVHACGQIANFKTSSNISLQKLKTALNCLLPEDIKIKELKQTSLDFNARYAAKSKIYRYTILNQLRNFVFTRNYVWHIPQPLDLKLIKSEAKELVGEHNFKAFQAADKILKPAVRFLQRIEISAQDNFLFIDFEANGFLYHMVRNIVGTLVEVGRGKLAKGSLKTILQSLDRTKAGPTAPAKGLCLLKVKYDWGAGLDLTTR